MIKYFRNFKLPTFAVCCNCFISLVSDDSSASCKWSRKFSGGRFDLRKYGIYFVGLDIIQNDEILNCQ